MGVVQVDEDGVEMGQDGRVDWIEGFVVRHFDCEYALVVYVLWLNINLYWEPDGMWSARSPTELRPAAVG